MTGWAQIAGKLFISLLCGLAVLQLGSCSDRSRLNPLDPKNPNTLGQPTGLAVVSMRDTVDLRWNRLDIRDLSGFRIYRQVEGESRFSPIAVTASGINSFRDIGVKFGIVHAYRIAALAEDFESLPSAAVTITPGPTFSWVADEQTGELVKLTHDGMHEILRSDFIYSPFRLQIDEKRDCVWVLDRFYRDLVRVKMNGRISGRFASINGPADLAVNPADGSVWVADSLNHGLMKFNSEGTPIFTNESFKKISALAVNPATSELWALDRASLRVLILSRTGELQRVASVKLRRPSDLDIDARSGEVWIADGSQVFLLNAEGQEKAVFAHDSLFVSRLAVDQTSGACWLIDYSREFRNSHLIKLTPEGNVLPIAEKFDVPQGLAVNPYDGSCLGSDTGTGRLIRISSNGRIIGSYERIVFPSDIDIAFSQ